MLTFRYAASSPSTLCGPMALATRPQRPRVDTLKKNPSLQIRRRRAWAISDADATWPTEHWALARRDLRFGAMPLGDDAVQRSLATRHLLTFHAAPRRPRVLTRDRVIASPCIAGRASRARALPRRARAAAIGLRAGPNSRSNLRCGRVP